VGVGRWDLFAIEWLYGAKDDAHAAEIATAGVREVALRRDHDARRSASRSTLGSMWEDTADPATELERMMAVAARAGERFGPTRLRR
jgi:hypothetical protein